MAPGLLGPIAELFTLCQLVKDESELGDTCYYSCHDEEFLYYKNKEFTHCGDEIPCPPVAFKHLLTKSNKINYKRTK